MFLSPSTFLSAYRNEDVQLCPNPLSWLHFAFFSSHIIPFRCAFPSRELDTLSTLISASVFAILANRPLGW